MNAICSILLYTPVLLELVSLSISAICSEIFDNKRKLTQKLNAKSHSLYMKVREKMLEDIRESMLKVLIIPIILFLLVEVAFALTS